MRQLKNLFKNSTLATKIRYSYFLFLIPMVMFLVICIFNMLEGNHKYEDMINSALVASDFSLDFKKDYDYETYLLIVGNTTIEESKLKDLLSDANHVVAEMEELTDSKENKARLKSVKRYLRSLQTYKNHIDKNLIIGDRYEENLKIWENDVQIVTTLLHETIFQYIYYEIRDLQQARIEYQNFYLNMIRGMVAVFIGITVVITFFSYYISQSITSPIRELSSITDQVAKGNLAVRSQIQAGAEVGTLSDSLNTMIDKINELLNQVTMEQTSLRKAEFEILHAQINPHFLYNTLDTIVWLAEAGDQTKVVSMVGSLSEFFRTSLNQGKNIVTIKEEIQHVNSYLEIQQIRYQDILEYEINIPNDLDQFLIPKITIQPLVENALYHGIKNKRGKGKITISAKKEADYFEICVSDNGIGMQQERLLQVLEGIKNKVPDETDIYGLYSTNERIRLNFGEQYGIRISSTYLTGTEVAVKLPYVENAQLTWRMK